MPSTSEIKATIIKKIRDEGNLANARELVDSMNMTCFEKCIPKPGPSISSSEQQCITQCCEKWMSAFNVVNKTFLARVQQEFERNSLTNM